MLEHIELMADPVNRPKERDCGDGAAHTARGGSGMSVAEAEAPKRFAEACLSVPLDEKGITLFL